jgi:hypothetical protein
MAKSSTTFKQIVWRWLPLATISVILTAFIGGAVQQNYRQSANDPQIQLAEDTARVVNAGSPPVGLVPTQRVDREQSLAPFVIIVNNQLHILATNAASGSDSLLPPSGVFDNARAHGEQRLTWQTAQGVRYATVVTPTTHGYVVAARSLKEVEAREHWLTVMDGLALLGLLTLTLIAVTVTS